MGLAGLFRGAPEPGRGGVKDRRSARLALVLEPERTPRSNADAGPTGFIGRATHRS